MIKSRGVAVLVNPYSETGAFLLSKPPNACIGIGNTGS
jgi:hypothetical protein